jgi:hypothetical protein
MLHTGALFVVTNRTTDHVTAQMDFVKVSNKLERKGGEAGMPGGDEDNKFPGEQQWIRPFPAVSWIIDHEKMKNG